MGLDLGTAMVLSSALGTLFGGGGGASGEMPGWLQDWVKRLIRESYGPGGFGQAIRLGGTVAAGMPTTYQTLAAEMSRRPWDTARSAGAFAAAADAARRYGLGATRGVMREAASRYGPGPTSYDAGTSNLLANLVADAVAKEAYAQRADWLQNLSKLFDLQNAYVRQWMPKQTGL